MKQFLLNSFSALLVILTGCAGNQENSNLSTEIMAEDIQSHIAYLASDDLKGRETGTAGEAYAASYIANHFEQFGLKPAGDEGTYFQEFTVNMSRLNKPNRPDTVSFKDEERIARNVIGMLKGTGESESFIVLGGHYDHLGTGKFGSLFNRKGTIVHNGADDNASGTAGVLELAQYFNEYPTKKSLLFIAFSGEEMGLLGSQYFVEHPTVPLDKIMAMINMDMIGRLKNNKLLIFGTGSSNSWRDLIAEANRDSLTIEMIPSGTGASDHTSFYNQQIPVLHYFTDTHADYHRPSDDAEYINAEGETHILEHIKRMVLAIDNLSAEELAYTEAPVTQNRNVTMSGTMLGVTPDYGFDGTGMRITGVRGGGPADEAGLKSGDIIIRLADKDLKDIYAYMKVLNELKEGQQTTVTILRDGNVQILEITL